ncbi:hypothetical protein V8C86DRAFT_1805075, partial [Haematococcus lacustris]
MDGSIFECKKHMPICSGSPNRLVNVIKLNITMTSSRHIVMAKAMYTLSSPLLPHISHLTCNHKC